MKAFLHRRRTQRGAALILFITVLVLGVAWYAVGALGKIRSATAEREAKTGIALHAAKQALLAYAVQYAARTDFDVPGRLPCPELLDSIGTANEGSAATSCSNAVAEIGRLPWRTLGTEQPRDGHGETLWYVLGPGFRQAPINFGSSGQLTLDGAANAAVALIVAPGVALNTLNEPGPPPAGCTTVNQQANRYASPLAVAKFFECGNATASYVTVAPAPWSNDRVLAITAAELMDAISGAVADRLQRQVLPALWRWDADELAQRGKSWGATHGLPYLPFASTFGDPATSSYCGTAGTAAAQREGLPPIASTSSASCSSSWTITSFSDQRISNFGCTQTGTEVECSGQRSGSGAGPTARINLRAAHVAESFRGTIRASDVIVTQGGTPAISTMSISSTNGRATTRIDVDWPDTVPTGATVTVRIPNLADAAVLTDPRVTWFLNNEWYRYIYYAVSRAETVNQTTVCTSPTDTDCIQVRGLPTSTGTYWDKRLVLVLSGPALPGQSRPSGDIAQYFEEHNALTGDRVYRADFRVPNPDPATEVPPLVPPYPAFNDRVAACPFQLTDAGGTVTICN